MFQKASTEKMYTPLPGFRLLPETSRWYVTTVSPFSRWKKQLFGAPEAFGKH